MSSPFANPVGQAPLHPDDVERERWQFWLGVGFLVFLSLVLAATNIVVPSLLNHLDDNPVAGFLFGLCIAEVNLIALWGVMAPGRFLLRLPWAGALLTIMWYTLVIGNNLSEMSFQLHDALQLGLVLLLCLPAAMVPLAFVRLYFGWRIQRRADVEVREQISFTLLLGGMTLLAVLLGMGRAVLPATELRISPLEPELIFLLAAVVGFNLLQTTPAIWVAFLPWRIAGAYAASAIAYAVVLSVAEIGVISLVLGAPPNFVEILMIFTSMNLAQILLVLGTLVSLRLLGFKLMRPGAGVSPFAKEQSPFADSARNESELNPSVDALWRDPGLSKVWDGLSKSESGQASQNSDDHPASDDSHSGDAV